MPLKRKWSQNSVYNVRAKHSCFRWFFVSLINYSFWCSLVLFPFSSTIWLCIIYLYSRACVCVRARVITLTFDYDDKMYIISIESRIEMPLTQPHSMIWQSIPLYTCPICLLLSFFAMYAIGIVIFCSTRFKTKPNSFVICIFRWI